MKRFLFLACLTLSSLTIADVWTDDYAAALEQSKKEKKDLLLYFTGTDWCTYCMALDEEVLSKDHFQTEVPKTFILVKLEILKKTEQPEEIVKRNKALMKKYGVRGFPTIILAGHEEKGYAQLGYNEGTSPEKYVTHLKQATVFKPIQTAIDGEKWEEAVKLIESFQKSEGALPELVQQALVVRAMIFEKLGKSKEELIQALEEAKAADPESALAERIQELIDKLKEN